MKNIWIVCLLVAASFSAWSIAHAQQHNSASALVAGQNGRYQLSTATIDFSAVNGTPTQRTIIRIDTQTGKTWELENQPTSGGGFESLWIPLNETK